MPAGALRDIVVCVPGSVGIQGPCPAGATQQVFTAYVVDPGAASFLEAVAQPYDYAAGAQLWAFAFVFTVSLYFFSHSIGLILSKIRRG